METKYLDEDGEPIYWHTKDGKSMLLEEMETSHLFNAKKMLERQILSAPFPCFSGEMAQYCAEKDYEEMIRKHSEFISLFNDELRLRGVDIESGTCLTCKHG